MTVCGSSTLSTSPPAIPIAFRMEPLRGDAGVGSDLDLLLEWPLAELPLSCDALVLTPTCPRQPLVVVPRVISVARMNACCWCQATASVLTPFLAQGLLHLQAVQGAVTPQSRIIKLCALRIRKVHNRPRCDAVI